MEICISDFKARSLKLLNKIHHSGESITVTMRGIPIARVVPICDHKNDIDLKYKESMHIDLFLITVAYVVYWIEVYL